ncbi:efflux RND transporter periplasmic adaptor subunit [Paracoccus sp. 1_MG-2023]|uniref:efflux RND transporter periplasmic adaptor subunit n=1 Tax=unclassified Paracoccus (in: a-proteobacteria) TaxID=2688777 RepID=UPI001C09E323|nr:MULTISPECIES: efflux RND transporter periplasmic adaptor subunit [unclassified Paracoccus (in: a-proteobacteria)]MBU2958773.1 efflux RND transporter periplasmic adaptor subunit [Paracoccus sp. C2R09]MDO6667766.1 efflux RND transporter periplasmic adaptor subunit [Paracoccus sp. 1_MG-2023]
MRRLLSSSTLVFLGILAFLVLWIGGGMLGREAPEQAAPAEIPPPEVAASESRAETIRPESVLFGNVVPNQRSILRPRTGGIIEDVARVGTRVEAGDPVGRISADDREATLARARAELAAAERDYEAAEQLQGRGVISDAEARNRFAALESARANLRAAELELQNTNLTAPITGIVSDVPVEIGSFVQSGGEVLEIVNNDPLKVEIQVRQSEITAVTLDQTADVEFQDDRMAEGRVTFISPVADPDTRTFKVELEVANPDSRTPAGLAAKVRLPLQERTAHRISPALIRLNDAGRIGVFVVAEDGAHLRFLPVDVVQAQAEAIWVTGLPDVARIVTISQGALSDGQAVRVEETPPEFRGVLGDEMAASDAAALIGDAVQE